MSPNDTGLNQGRGSIGLGSSDPSMSGVGFSSAPRDPDAIPVTINRPKPAAPAPVVPTAPAIADDGPMPPTPVRPGGPDTSHLFTSDHHNTPPAGPAPMPPKSAGPKRNWLLWIVVLIVAILVAGYLAADDGLIRGGSHLPYHIFSKYKTNSSSTSTNNSSTTTSSSVPTGFTQYQLSGPGVEFSAPTAWGTPTYTSDPGYSQRGGSNKSDGTHATLVKFSKNTDVQIALTSGNLLPASKSDNRYFDGLRWCTGSIDGKYYYQSLAYTTASGVDTPSTVVCDQGPLANVTAIDATTIVAAKAKLADGSTLGDLYIKNLSGNQNAAVMRVVDAASSSSSDIKTLLGTVQNL